MTRVGWWEREGRHYHGSRPGAGWSESGGPETSPVDPEEALARELAAIAGGYPSGLPLAAGVRGLLDQLVEPVESGPAVGADVAGVDLGPDAPQIGDGPVGEGGPAAEDDLDSTVGGDARKRKPRDRAAPEGS